MNMVVVLHCSFEKVFDHRGELFHIFHKMSETPSKEYLGQSILGTLSNINDGDFCRNCLWLQDFDYLYENVRLRTVKCTETQIHYI